MRVLHILWTGEIGGKERAVYQLVRSQLEFSSFVRPAIAFGKMHGHYVGAFRELGCPVVDFQMRSGRDVARAFADGRRLMAPFDAHHFHSAELPLVIASGLIGKRGRIYTHRGGHPALSIPKRIKYRLMGMVFNQKFTALSANTKHAARAAAVLTGVPQSRWAVTYNGMDFSALTPKRPPIEVKRGHAIAEDKVVIGTSANLRTLKRIDYLLRAFARLSSEQRGRAHVLIVGDGPDRGRLEAIAAELKIGNSVTITGMQADIAPYLAAMDIYVLPSNSQESFGNALVEAMAAGLPSIIFADGGGLLEHITDRSNGWIVPSIEALSTRLEKLIDDRDLRQSVGQAASKHVRETYSLKRMVENYDAVYRQSGTSQARN